MSSPVRLQGWSKKAIDKARMFELITGFSSLAATYCPELVRFTAPCIKRLCPVRLSPEGRSLRAWGRDYRFNPDDAEHAKKLVKAFRNGTRCVVLGEGALSGHQALTDGVIQKNGGTFWLEEPTEEKSKPKLVLYVNAEPEDVLSLEGRAIAILAEHPEWSKTRIAAEVPCSRAALYTFPMFMAACEMQEKGREKYNPNRDDD